MLDSRLRLGCCLALLGAAAVPPPTAPESAPRSAEAFVERVDVRVVSVDVYVTDRKGEPVQGLGADDFEAYDDGRQVELSNFFEKRAAGAAPAASGPAADAAPVELPATREAALRTVPAPLTFVVYVDNSTLVAAHRNRVLDELAEFLAEQSVRADLRFGLAIFDADLEVVVPVSDRIEPILEGLERIRHSAATGLREVAERRHLRRTLIDLHREAGGCAEAWGGMVAMIEGYAGRASRRLAAAQAGLVSLARSLSGLPGRKAILYLSDGLQQLPGLDFHDYIGEICPARGLETMSNAVANDESPLFSELTAFASTHSVTFYPLETKGLQTLSVDSVEWGPEDRNVISRDSIDTPQPSSEYGYIPSPRNDQIRDVNYKAGLAIMAKETGGKAIFNANSPKRDLDRLAGDFDNYYSLGFSPPAGWDGRRHEIFVRLVGDAAKGRSLRYRTSYQAVSRDEWMAERALSALVLGLETNPLGIEAGFGAPEPLAGGAFRARLEIAVDLGRLTLVGEPAARGLLRVVVVAEDLRNQRSPVREKLIPIELGGAGRAPAGRHRFVVDLELDAGEHWIGIGVRDEIGAEAAYLRRMVSIPESQASLARPEAARTASGGDEPGARESAGEGRPPGEAGSRKSGGAFPHEAGR